MSCRLRLTTLVTRRWRLLTLLDVTAIGRLVACLIEWDETRKWRKKFFIRNRPWCEGNWILVLGRRKLKSCNSNSVCLLFIISQCWCLCVWVCLCLDYVTTFLSYWWAYCQQLQSDLSFSGMNFHVANRSSRSFRVGEKASRGANKTFAISIKRHKFSSEIMNEHFSLASFSFNIKKREKHGKKKSKRDRQSGVEWINYQIISVLLQREEWWWAEYFHRLSPDIFMRNGKIFSFSWKAREWIRNPHRNCFFYVLWGFLNIDYFRLYRLFRGKNIIKIHELEPRDICTHSVDWKWKFNFRWADECRSACITTELNANKIFHQKNSWNLRRFPWIKQEFELIRKNSATNYEWAKITRWLGDSNACASNNNEAKLESSDESSQDLRHPALGT